MYQDFNYVMRNGWWYHIEFESDPLTKADLRRFREYEAATSRTYGVEVLTCVICTANRKHILTEITEGINTYRVKLIQMKKKDGDKILRKIQKKKKLKRKDLIPDPGAAQPSYERQIRDQNPDTGRNQGSE